MKRAVCRGSGLSKWRIFYPFENLFPVVICLFGVVLGKPTNQSEEHFRRNPHPPSSGLHPRSSAANDEWVRELTKYISGHWPDRQTSNLVALPRNRRDEQRAFHREQRSRVPARNANERRSLNFGIDIGTMAPAANQSDEELMRLLNEDLKPLFLEALNHTPSAAEEAHRQFAADFDIGEDSTHSTAAESKAMEATTLCNECKEVENIILQEKKQEMKITHSLLVRPLYPCDEWDPKSRTCYLDRNLGDTVTFVLGVENLGGERGRIDWRQEFHLRNSDGRKDIVLNPDNPPWNIVIGTQGYEFRVSPISEIDIDFNRFSATVLAQESHSSELPPVTTLNKVTFQIRTVAVDLGFVYPGEALTLNIHSFVTLPLESMHYKWYLEREGELSTLPSNMRTSPTGGSVAISELRKEQEGVLTCSVYTNKDIFATKKRFLIKELVTDVLMGMDSIKHVNLKDFDLLPHKLLRRRSRQVPNEDEVDFANMERNIEEKNRKPDDGFGTGAQQSRVGYIENERDEMLNGGLGFNSFPSDTNYPEKQQSAIKGGAVAIENNNGLPEVVPLAGDASAGLENNVRQMVQSPEQNRLPDFANAEDASMMRPDMEGRDDYGEANGRSFQSVKRVQVSEANRGGDGVVMEIEKNLETNDELPFQEQLELANNGRGSSASHNGPAGSSHGQSLEPGYQRMGRYSNNHVASDIRISEPRLLEEPFFLPSGKDRNAEELIEGRQRSSAANLDLQAAPGGRDKTIEISKMTSSHHDRPSHPAGHHHHEQDRQDPQNGFVIDIEKEVLNREVKAEDRIARLLSECHRDAQCSGHGTCVRGPAHGKGLSGFCRCRTGYHGSGIFCWEDTNVRSFVEEETIAEIRGSRKSVAPPVAGLRTSSAHNSFRRRRRNKS